MGNSNTHNAYQNNDSITMQINDRLRIDRKSDAREKKILLLGAESSGKSTISKQIEFIYNINNNESTYLTNGYRQYILTQIREQCIKFIVNNFAVSKYYDQDIAVYLNQHNKCDLVKIGNLIQDIWRLHKMKIKRKTANNSFYEYMSYFMNKITEIMCINYTLTENDILHVHIKGCSMVDIQYTGITIPEVQYRIYHYERINWLLYKKLYLFTDCTAVLFVAALNGYCQEHHDESDARYLYDNAITMQASLEYFDDMVNRKWFRKSEFILFLNKDDLFQECIKSGKSLSICFGDEWNGPDFINCKINLIVSNIVRNVEVLLDNFSCYVPSEIVDLIILYSRLKYVINDREVDEEEYFQYCYKNALSFITNKYKQCSKCIYKRVFVYTVNAMDRNVMKKVFCDLENLLCPSNIIGTGGFV